MSKRNKRTRMLVSILISILMIFECFTLYAMEVTQTIDNEEAVDNEETVDNEQTVHNGDDYIPSVVLGSDGYREIPIYFEGKKVCVFEKFLRKNNDTELNGGKFDISGITTFRVRAYAYKTSAEVKLGTYIECLDKDGNWIEMDWYDQVGQVSETTLKEFIKSGKELNLTIKEIGFVLPKQNETEKRVIFTMGASTGGEFSRGTQKNVEFTIDNSPLSIKRKVTEVSGEKNVWEVEVMVEQLSTSEKDAVKDAILTEELISNILIDLPEGDKKAGILVTQGNVVSAETDKVTWNMGELEYGKPAIIKYKINLTSGKIGELYNVSKDGKLTYTNVKSEKISRSIPNEQIDLSWVKINMSTLDQNSNTIVSNSEISLWYKVPEPFVVDSMKFNYKQRYNLSSKEISDTGDTVVEDGIKLQSPQGTSLPVIVGALVDNRPYTKIEMQTVGVSLTHSPTVVINLINNPKIQSQVNDRINVIQPEGVSTISVNIVFDTASKDISYILDISTLKNTKIDTNFLMNYDFEKSIVCVEKLKSEKKSLVEGVDYTRLLTDSDITFKFTDIVDAGDEFKIEIYVPTTMGVEVTYGGLGTSYLNNFKGTKVEVDNIIKSTPKINEVKLEDGTYEKIYGVETTVSSTEVIQNKIMLTYMEISRVN